MCAGALQWSQLNRVVYGASDSKRGFHQAGIQLHPKTLLTGGVLKDQAKALLDQFFAKKRA
jgi:tRNA(adenine34) deaminase